MSHGDSVFPPPASGAAAACPLCTAASTSVLFERRNVPVLLNRLYDSAAAARSALTANLRIAACDGCGFVFNSAFDPSLIGYNFRYENDQGNSPAFAAHMSLMADRILGASTDRNDIAVVEIGCGQARFLAALVERAGPRIAAAFGYDPAWRGEPSTPPIRIVRGMFDPQALRRLARPVDAILSRHVIEHLPDPVSFLRGIREALPASWPGRLFLETPSLEWIVDGRVLHDFFHEHCNYFTATALDRALARAGFRALRIDRVFGGQYLWAEAAADQPDARLPATVDDLPSLRELASCEVGFRARWHATLAPLRGKGNTAIWGAGAKGVTFANMLDPHSQLVACLIDINSKKQNRFVPVTAHPVRNPRDAMRDGIGRIIIMNPNYRAEIEAEVSRTGEHPILLDA